MPWSSQWQSCLRGSKPVPALICYTLWLRRWRCTSPHACTGEQGSSDAYHDKYRRYPTPTGWVAMLAEEELLPHYPKPLDPGVPEPDIIEGLSLRMTQAMCTVPFLHWVWTALCGISCCLLSLLCLYFSCFGCSGNSAIMLGNIVRECTLELFRVLRSILVKYIYN